MPASLTLKLPEGWRAEELRFPPAEEHTDAAGITHVYHGQVLIPLTITPAQDARTDESVSVTGTAMWLVCNDVCVPQSADLALRVRISTGEPVVTDHWKRAINAKSDRGNTPGKNRGNGAEYPETEPHTEKPQ
jgi:thiol:disulfide interchange protein DsbD